ncbi:MAG: hypothetical protein ABIU77_18135 [Ferruginibacter sp.]
MVLWLLSTTATSFMLPGDPVPALRLKLAKYYANFPKEKVYLQPDKQQYAAGETVWFSGYVTRHSKPLPGNGVLYAELFNDKGFIVTRAMRPVTKGRVYGELVLPATLRAGTYYLRAYTAWMLNFSSSLFFYRKIMVGGNATALQPKTVSGKSDFSVQFFPESGQLVNRLTSQVVFKALDTNGIAVPVTGRIINNWGDTVASIKTVQDGMGSFVLHCNPQTNYTAIVTANGFTKRIALPSVQPSGIVLHTETKNNAVTDSVFFHISRSGENKEKYEHLLLCARMENRFSITKIHFNDAAFNDPSDTILTAPYPLLLNNFDAGVLQLAVLTEEGTILAERSVFLNDHQPAAATIQSIEHNVAEGNTSVVIKLSAEYKGTIAVSVTGAEKVYDSGSVANIRSGLLLTAEAMPPLLTPGMYVTDQGNGAAKALDMLMITSKPAGLDLRQLLQDEMPVVRYAPEKSMMLKGRAFEINGDKKTPLSNSALFVILKATKDSLSVPLNVLTDSAGYFTLHDLYFHDTATIFVQTGVKSQGRTTNSVAVEFEHSIFDSFSKNSFVIAPALLNMRFNRNDTFADNPDEASTMGVLKNVTVTTKIKTHIDSVVAKYATGIFANPGSWATTLDLTRDEIAKNTDQNVLEYLNGKVAGLVYAYNKGLPIIYWRFSNMIDGLSAMDQLKLNAPSFFLNESLLNTGNEGYDGMVQLLTGIRVADVAIIRVYKPGTMPNVPDNGPHGSVAIYLKNGTEEDKPASKIAFQQTVKVGYTVAHNFEIQQKESITPTLYWNPAAIPDPATHTIIVTVRNGNTQRLRIVAEGLDENGRVIQLDQVIQ